MGCLLECCTLLWACGQQVCFLFPLCGQGQQFAQHGTAGLCAWARVQTKAAGSRAAPSNRRATCVVNLPVATFKKYFFKVGEINLNILFKPVCPNISVVNIKTGNKIPSVLPFVPSHWNPAGRHHKPRASHFGLSTSGA